MVVRTVDDRRGNLQSVRRSTSCLALVVAVAGVAMGGGCGGDQLEIDPRELRYCGGVCYGTWCCAPSDDACPELMPLRGSECDLEGVRCGYACGDPSGARYHMAACRSGVWDYDIVICD
jgi:hypothetical protein